MGVHMTILSVSLTSWEMVILHRLGFEFSEWTQKKLLKIEDSKETLAKKRAGAEYRQSENQRRDKKRKDNRSKRSKNSNNLPYRNQNAVNSDMIQLISGKTNYSFISNKSFRWWINCEETFILIVVNKINFWKFSWLPFFSTHLVVVVVCDIAD